MGYYKEKQIEDIRRGYSLPDENKCLCARYSLLAFMSKTKCYFSKLFFLQIIYENLIKPIVKFSFF